MQVSSFCDFPFVFFLVFCLVFFDSALGLPIKRIEKYLLNLPSILFGSSGAINLGFICFLALLSEIAFFMIESV